MANPVVFWYDRSNQNQLTQWPIGTVNAGEYSAQLGVLIWNNRGGATDVSDMTGCTITTKDILGGNGTSPFTEPVVNKWIEVRVDSNDETGFTAIGGAVTHPIKARGAAPDVISGAANTGNKDTDIANYAECTLQANVPTNASAGTSQFLVRVSFSWT